MSRLHIGISLLALTCALPAAAQDMDQVRCCHIQCLLYGPEIRQAKHLDSH
jgi:hypothetical protein